MEKMVVLTAAELDDMTPNERAAAFDERVVKQLDDLPTKFRSRVMKTGRQISSDLRPTSAE